MVGGWLRGCADGGWVIAGLCWWWVGRVGCDGGWMGGLGCDGVGGWWLEE